MTQASIECRAGDKSLLLRVPGTGAPQWQLNWLASVTLAVRADVRRVCALGGRWGREFQEQWDTLHGLWVEPEMVNPDSEMGGPALAQLGLPLLPMNPGTAWVLELEAC